MEAPVNDPEGRTCSSCEQHLSSNQFPTAPNDTKCTHDVTTCSGCWMQWLQIQVATNTFDRIHYAECTGLLGQSEIKHLAAEDVYQRYLDAELRSTLSLDPNFYWCMSGTCSHGQLHFDGDIFTCQECGHKACMTCKSPWHGGETCDDYQIRKQQGQHDSKMLLRDDAGKELRTIDVDKALQRRQAEEEAAAEETLSKVSKLCPGCARKVQKNGGCDHILCTACDFEFCWDCLVDYSQIRARGASTHEHSCRNYVAPPRPVAPVQIPARRMS